MNTDDFYGPAQAAIHHDRFGDLAPDAADARRPARRPRPHRRHGHRPRLRLRHPRRHHQRPRLRRARLRHLPRHARARRAQRAQGDLPSGVAGRCRRSRRRSRSRRSARPSTTPPIRRAGLRRHGVGRPARLRRARARRRLPLRRLDAGSQPRPEVRERIHENDGWMLTLQADEQRRPPRPHASRSTPVSPTVATSASTSTTSSTSTTRPPVTACSRTSASPSRHAPNYGADRGDSTPPMGWSVFVATKPASRATGRATLSGGRPTVLVSRYSSKPAMPCSRPRPDSL